MRKGSVMLPVIVFILVFAGFAAILESTLSQRAESKRYVSRNNALYSLNAFMDLYTDTALAVVDLKSIDNVIIDPTADVQTSLEEAIKTLNGYEEEYPENPLESFGLTDIYDICNRLVIDNQIIKDEMALIMSDNIDIWVTTDNGEPFLKPDWDSRYTVVDGVTDGVFEGIEPEDPESGMDPIPLQQRIHLEPVRLEFHGNFRSYQVVKTVELRDLFIDIEESLEGEGVYRLEVNGESSSFTVLDYKCYQ